MSVLRKKPYIEQCLAKMSAEQLILLRTAMNTNSPSDQLYSLVNKSYFLPVTEGTQIIKAVRMELERNKPAYNGILIYTSELCLLIGYHRFQDLALFEINPVNRSYKRINEFCDINELRRCLDDALETEVPDFDVTAETIDSGSATSGQVLTANGEGGATWSDAGGGLPEATKAGQVVVSNDELEAEWADAAPLADNLLANPINNDALYSKGPTGGLADISTGEEAYLQEIKGYSIVWNQLLDSEHTSHTLDSSRVYAYYGNDASGWTIFRNNNSTMYWVSGLVRKLFDLTLMFGGNDKIPFSLTDSVEYPANGSIPAQTVKPVMRFQRLFANVDLYNAPYDAGTIKNVKATTLVETGRNLWDSSMSSTGIQLLAGYSYEIFPRGNRKNFRITGGMYNDSSVNLTRYQRADGKYVWLYTAPQNVIATFVAGCDYVGFVHSGNYCLTTGTNTNSTYPVTTETIPAYQKHEFSISGINGLNGVSGYNGDTPVELYDTKDYRKIGSMDLANYQNVMIWNADMDGWQILKSDLPNDFNLEMLNQVGGLFLCSVYFESGIEAFHINESDESLLINNDDSTNKPIGILLYPLTEPVATGESAFEPIPLKSGDNWIVDDMGQEYFIQPSNTNCPVNQVSYYYENLKDKLVNLQDPIEVSVTTDFDYNSQYLTGLKIGNTKYNNIPAKFSAGNIALAIGYNLSSSLGTYAIGLGADVTALGYCSTVIGANAYVSAGQYSVAIGNRAYTKLQSVITFDGQSSDNTRTLLCYDATKIFFRDELVKNNETSGGTNPQNDYKKGFYLSDYIQNNDAVLEGGKYYISYTDASNYKTFSKNVVNGAATDLTSVVKGVNVTVLLSTNVSVHLALLPYDSANSQTIMAYGLASDTPTFVLAYIDSDGCVVVTPPSGVTITSVMYNLR